METEGIEEQPCIFTKSKILNKKFGAVISL